MTSIDQCIHCEVKGDLEACQSQPCSKHDSWYAKELKQQVVFWKAKAEGQAQPE